MFNMTDEVSTSEFLRRELYVPDEFEEDPEDQVNTCYLCIIGKEHHRCLVSQYEHQISRGGEESQCSVSPAFHGFRSPEPSEIANKFLDMDILDLETDENGIVTRDIKLEEDEENSDEEADEEQRGEMLIYIKTEPEEQSELGEMPHSELNEERHMDFMLMNTLDMKRSINGMSRHDQQADDFVVSKRAGNTNELNADGSYRPEARLPQLLESGNDNPIEENPDETESEIAFRSSTIHLNLALEDEDSDNRDMIPEIVANKSVESDAKSAKLFNLNLMGLFVQPYTAEPLLFGMKPGNAKDSICTHIWAGGGSIENSNDIQDKTGHRIELCDPCDVNLNLSIIDVDIFDYKYILNCIKHNTLLENLKEYRTNTKSLYTDYDPLEILCGLQKWTDLCRIPTSTDTIRSSISASNATQDFVENNNELTSNVDMARQADLELESTTLPSDIQDEELQKNAACSSSTYEENGNSSFSRLHHFPENQIEDESIVPSNNVNENIHGNFGVSDDVLGDVENGEETTENDYEVDIPVLCHKSTAKPTELAFNHSENNSNQSYPREKINKDLPHENENEHFATKKNVSTLHQNYSLASDVNFLEVDGDVNYEEASSSIPARTADVEGETSNSSKLNKKRKRVTNELRKLNASNDFWGDDFDDGDQTWKSKLRRRHKPIDLNIVSPHQTDTSTIVINNSKSTKLLLERKSKRCPFNSTNTSMLDDNQPVIPPPRRKPPPHNNNSIKNNSKNVHVSKSFDSRNGSKSKFFQKSSANINTLCKYNGSKALQNTKYITNWVPRLKGKKLIIEGNLLDFDHEDPAHYTNRYVTSKVLQRKNSNLVITKGGEYWLEGKLNILEAMKHATPKFIIDSFWRGVPEQWETYKQQWRGEIKGRKQTNSYKTVVNYYFNCIVNQNEA